MAAKALPVCFTVRLPVAVGATDFCVNFFHVKNFRFCVFGHTEYETYIQLLSNPFYGDL